MRETKWYALFVGVDDYPGEAFDLRGARNDVRAWWRLTRAWGLPADRVLVCTAPVMSAADLGVEGAGGPRCFEATSKGLGGALDALAELVDGEADARVLLGWTGHGATVHGDGGDSGTLLALADYDPARLGEGAHVLRDGALHDGLVPLLNLTDRLRAIVGGDPKQGAPEVVAFVDVCHAADPVEHVAAAGSGVTTLADAGVMALTAALPGQKAHMIRIGTEARGVFSWAVTTLLDRFGFERGASRLTPAELYYRARTLLEAMEARQTPMLFSLTGQNNRRLLGGLGEQAIGAGRAEDGDPLGIHPLHEGTKPKLRGSGSGPRAGSGGR